MLKSASVLETVQDNGMQVCVLYVELWTVE